MLGAGALVTLSAPLTLSLPKGAGVQICWNGDIDPATVHLRVSDAGLAIDAAAVGMGQAKVPALLAAADVAAGRVSAGETLPIDKTYWLIAPLPQWRQKKVKALVAALAG